MKKSRSFLAVLIVSLSYVLSPVTAKADLWDVPVAPGETFRWVFVTSDTTPGTAPNISYYNDFVNDAADSVVAPLDQPLTGVAGVIDSIGDIEWRAIAVTVDQHDFIVDFAETARIFTPDGSLVADDMSGLFNLYPPFEHLNPMNISEDGSPVAPEVWTGFWDGHWLGTTESMLGDNTLLHMGWLYWSTAPTTEEHHIYGISEELTVVPVPSALILGATGLLSSTLGLIRLRRKHQEPKPDIELL